MQPRGFSLGTEVKILSDNGRNFTVAGYGVIFGGHDVERDYFSKTTDFWFDRVTESPVVLYQHGMDAMFGQSIIGRVSSKRIDDVGIWIEAQISVSKKYADAIRELVKRGVLGWSSGSVSHLVQRTKGATPGTKEITSWPIVELSLTPTPAEPRTIGVKELKSLAAADPLLFSIFEDAEREAKAISDTGGTSVKDLPDDAFAYVKSGGVLDDNGLTTPRANRQFPHHAEDGSVDTDLLQVALLECRKSVDTPSEARAHLELHRMAQESGEHDEAHDAVWKTGNAPRVLSLVHMTEVAARATAAKRRAMEDLGYDVKDGFRTHAEVVAMYKAIRNQWDQIITKVEEIDRGVDGAAIVAMYRDVLDILDLEEVA